jgi:hypothetical protein
VSEKILFQYEIFNHDRFLLQMTVGTLPHEKVLRSIELFSTRFAPVIRKEHEQREPAVAAPANA